MKYSSYEGGVRVLERNYELLVNYGPFVTTTAFIIMYTYTIYDIHVNKVGTLFNRVFFSVLAVALIPKFLAQLTLMVVHGAYGPFVAELSNLLPVLYIILANEYYIRSNKKIASE